MWTDIIVHLQRDFYVYQTTKYIKRGFVRSVVKLGKILEVVENLAASLRSASQSLVERLLKEFFWVLSWLGLQDHLPYNWRHGVRFLPTHARSLPSSSKGILFLPLCRFILVQPASCRATTFGKQADHFWCTGSWQHAPLESRTTPHKKFTSDHRGRRAEVFIEKRLQRLPG